MTLTVYIWFIHWRRGSWWWHSRTHVFLDSWMAI